VHIDRNVDRRRQVDTAKHDSAVSRGRPQGQLDPLAAVHTHADGAGDGLESALGEHGHDFRSLGFPLGL
jgi:hypothetical protein